MSRAHPPELKELGDFLRARREELRPADVGLSPANHAARRVTGLKREEVAHLVSISTDYYTRIEQGRLAPSPPVLACIKRFFRLTEEQGDFLDRLLARVGHTRSDAPVATDDATSAAPNPRLVRLMSQCGQGVACVFDQHLNVLAWNDVATELVHDFSTIDPSRRNYIRLLTTSPDVQRHFADWRAVARTCIAVLRMNAAHDPGDPRLTQLVEELSLASGDFRAWWGERQVAHQNFGPVVLRHEVHGDFDLEWDSFRQPGADDQALVTYTAPPGSASAARLATLIASLRRSSARLVAPA